MLLKDKFFNCEDEKVLDKKNEDMIKMIEILDNYKEEMIDIENNNAFWKEQNDILYKENEAQLKEIIFLKNKNAELIKLNNELTLQNKNINK